MNGQNTEIATFGAGCFWCVEAIFRELKGVENVISGYSGGSKVDPSYEEVCSGTTGHAEATQISFDPKMISYEKLLEVFFLTHDPTTVNRQGYDAGTQYRSVVFYHSEEQKQLAEKVKQDIEKTGVYKNPIVTEITPFTNFYKAEDSHQKYYEKNSYVPYCQVVIDPKIAKLRERFTELLKSS